MYRFTRLDYPLQALAYQEFTFPLFRSRLQRLQPEGAIVAIAASFSSQPVGLALAEILPDGKSAEVLSVFVVANHRRRLIGSELLNRLEQELFVRGCITLQVTYITGQPTTIGWERLLQKCGWTQPQPRMVVCKTTTDRIVHAPWMQKSSLPDAYSIFPWMEITPEERLTIKETQQANPWIPPDLIPFNHEADCEPLNSVGLRYQGQVAGWVITHRLAPDTIRYSCSFVRRDLQKMGRIIPLYVNAINKQIDAKIPKGIWTVPYIHDGMVNFVQKRMAPYMNSVEESRGAYKTLLVTVGLGV
ncbi:GNAT family N-acetyltransferase [Iningainema tapete]|uniref:GNAT family N-acetyltransferase n=1 Tax=Iningainema tapete BLCC-T55 TaxID=2748662 RepID=A0A8J6XH17_9CYAN|nr:GNAT family N-acetyltransferase [Iningainema tapete]MBD2774173.1 GNAT family N-acetyltransferase [Iningainema tapete BLCC-T55]